MLLAAHYLQLATYVRLSTAAGSGLLLATYYLLLATYVRLSTAAGSGLNARQARSDSNASSGAAIVAGLVATLGSTKTAAAVHTLSAKRSNANSAESHPYVSRTCKGQRTRAEALLAADTRSEPAWRVKYQASNQASGMKQVCRVSSE